LRAQRRPTWLDICGQSKSCICDQQTRLNMQSWASVSKFIFSDFKFPQDVVGRKLLKLLTSVQLPWSCSKGGGALFRCTVCSEWVDGLTFTSLATGSEGEFTGCGTSRGARWATAGRPAGPSVSVKERLTDVFIVRACSCCVSALLTPPPQCYYRHQNENSLPE